MASTFDDLNTSIENWSGNFQSIAADKQASRAQAEDSDKFDGKTLEEFTTAIEATLATHAANNANPHALTAAQVNTRTSTDIFNATNTKINASHPSSTKYQLPITCLKTPSFLPIDAITPYPPIDRNMRVANLSSFQYNPERNVIANIEDDETLVMLLPLSNGEKEGYYFAYAQEAYNKLPNIVTTGIEYLPNWFTTQAKAINAIFASSKDCFIGQLKPPNSQGDTDFCFICYTGGSLNPANHKFRAINIPSINYANRNSFAICSDISEGGTTLYVIQSKDNASFAIYTVDLSDINNNIEDPIALSQITGFSGSTNYGTWSGLANLTVGRATVQYTADSPTNTTPSLVKTNNTANTYTNATVVHGNVKLYASYSSSSLRIRCTGIVKVPSIKDGNTHNFKATYTVLIDLSAKTYSLENDSSGNRSMINFGDVNTLPSVSGLLFENQDDSYLTINSDPTIVSNQLVYKDRIYDFQYKLNEPYFKLYLRQYEFTGIGPNNGSSAFYHDILTWPNVFLTALSGDTLAPNIATDLSIRINYQDRQYPTTLTARAFLLGILSSSLYVGFYDPTTPDKCATSIALLNLDNATFDATYHSTYGDDLLGCPQDFADYDAQYNYLLKTYPILSESDNTGSYNSGSLYIHDDLDPTKNYTGGFQTVDEALSSGSTTVTLDQTEIDQYREELIDNIESVLGGTVSEVHYMLVRSRHFTIRDFLIGVAKTTVHPVHFVYFVKEGSENAISSDRILTNFVTSGSNTDEFIRNLTPTTNVSIVKISDGYMVGYVPPFYTKFYQMGSIQSFHFLGLFQIQDSNGLPKADSSGLIRSITETQLGTDYLYQFKLFSHSALGVCYSFSQAGADNGSDDLTKIPFAKIGEFTDSFATLIAKLPLNIVNWDRTQVKVLLTQSVKDPFSFTLNIADLKPLLNGAFSYYIDQNNQNFFPTLLIDLKEIANYSDGVYQNKTWYLYIVDDPENGLTWSLESAMITDTDKTLYLGYVTTDDNGITDLKVEVPIKIGQYRLSTSASGNAIPVTTGDPTVTTTLPW